MAMGTDPAKVYRQDAGHPARCEVFAHHELWNRVQAASIRRACEHGALGCSDCREQLIRVGRLHRG